MIPYNKGVAASSDCVE